MPVTIEPACDRRGLRDFIRLPWGIYHGNLCWVPPLVRDVRDVLDTKVNPFWTHARRELFLAKRNGVPIGRLAAIIDETHNRIHGERTGFFGFFESVDDFETAAALWEAAANWLREQGMAKMLGPASPSLNGECGFLLEGFDKPPVVLMPYNPPYYLDLAARYGFSKAKDLQALLIREEDGIPKRIERLTRALRKRTGVKIRHLDMKHFDEDIQTLREVYNAAMSENWAFVPFSADEMRFTAARLKPVVEPDLILFAEMGGRTVGVSVTIPDLNEVLLKLNGRPGILGTLKFLYYRRRIKGLRSIIGAVLEEFRETGIIALLFHETMRVNKRLRYRWCELGWNLEDNDLINRFDMAIGGRIYKKYRLCEISL